MNNRVHEHYDTESEEQQKKNVRFQESRLQ